jgi:hypothetical protein
VYRFAPAQRPLIAQRVRACAQAITDDLQGFGWD